MLDQSVYLERVINRLNKLGLNGAIICQKILEFHCLMAGSFPLQCYLDEYYEGSDIDIFCLSGNERYKDWVLKTYPNATKDASTYIISGVIETSKYRINENTCINVILVDSKNLKKFIQESFDMTFCQTTFDGEILECYHEDLTKFKIGYVINPHSINDPKRKEKYLNRGFFILAISITPEQAMKFIKYNKDKQDKLEAENKLMKDKLAKLMAYGVFIGNEISASFGQLNNLLTIKNEC